MEVARAVMSGVIFLLGIASIIFGLVIIMTREYQETLRVLSSQSTRLSSRAILEDGFRAGSRRDVAIARFRPQAGCDGDRGRRVPGAHGHRHGVPWVLDVDRRRLAAFEKSRSRARFRVANGLSQ